MLNLTYNIDIEPHPPRAVPRLAAAYVCRSGHYSFYRMAYCLPLVHLLAWQYTASGMHLRGKTISGCFLTLSGRFATQQGRLYLALFESQ